MKLAAFSATLPHPTLDEVLDYLAENGIGGLELGAGGYPGCRHADPHVLAGSAAARNALDQAVRARDIELLALSCHGNPLHPDTARASRFHADFLATLEAANALEVPVVVGFSGQPGSGGAMNWPVIGWPDEYPALFERQWNDIIIPYWQPVVERARALGVRIAVELHGGFAVHSPATLRKLRDACGPQLGANLDPSHLWWQGIDPAAAAGRLGDAVFHVHLKDVCFRPEYLVDNGLLDCTPHTRMAERAWYFAPPGAGHDGAEWQRLLDALEAVGYSGALSIEHEGEEAATTAIAATARWIRRLCAGL